MSHTKPKTTYWICDSCHQPIGSVDDGWVEWVTYAENKGTDHGLRLVHHVPASPRKRGCQYDEDALFAKNEGMVNDLGLDHFVGPDGLTALLELTTSSTLPKEEIVLMIQRLHVPGYEIARLHIDAAIAEGIIEPNMAPGFHWQDEIARVLDWAKKKGRTPI